MNNILKTNLWVDISNGNVISNSPIMQVTAKMTNLKNVDAQELKEQERRSKNVVIHGIMEEIENTYIPWNCY